MTVSNITVPAVASALLTVPIKQGGTMNSQLCITCGYWVATIGDQCEACAGDPTVDLQGPTWCEKHPQTIWPHGDCVGPGMWVSNGTLRQWGIASREFDSLRSEVRNLQAKLDHYDGWFGDDCRCGEDPCPLTQP